MTDVEQSVPETNYVLELSTAIKPTPKFTIDGSEYNILTFDHLSAEAEANVTALLSRYDRMTQHLEITGSDSEAQSLAKKLRERRVDILCALTTIPRSIATKLPLPAQATLLEVVQTQLNPGSDDDDD